MRRFLFRPWTVALALLALCAVSYGMLAGKLGYFWDDWTIVWYIHFLGPSSFLDSLRHRPTAISPDLHAHHQPAG